jgi:putative ABC transport system ATP-binding protein/lipoprotein-releasing system ATP-binding protein
LHLLAGLDDPTTGEVLWPDLGSKEELRPRLVSVAFQGPTFLPALTVMENVALPLLLLATPEIEAETAVIGLLDRFDLGRLRAKFPDQLSGGQLQRAGLARALITRPRLVLLDEPTGQQDRATASRVLDVLQEHLARMDAAAVVATHDETVARRFPQRWSLDGGRLTTEAMSSC